MAPDLDQAEFDLDDAVQNLATYAAQIGDAHLSRLVDVLVLRFDEVLDQLGTGVHLELDFDPDAIEN